MDFHILVADDEAEIRDLLRLYLEKEHYIVVEASDGNQALELLSKGDIDLCILDIMMPGTDGFRVLQQLRRRSSIPVIILSAKDQDTDKILGLDLGADDYMAKPFNPLEAVARVNSAIRRAYRTNPGIQEQSDSIQNCVTVRDLTLDKDACLIYRGSNTIELTSVEYRIMELFMDHPGKVFTKQQIYEHGWQDDYIVADNNIMVCISKLRSKLDPCDPARYIRTIRGLGYRFEKEQAVE